MSQRLIERQERLYKEKTDISKRSRDNGKTKDKSLKLSLVKFFFYTLYTVEEGFDVSPSRE